MFSLVSRKFLAMRNIALYSVDIKSYGELKNLHFWSDSMQAALLLGGLFGNLKFMLILEILGLVFISIGNLWTD